MTGRVKGWVLVVASLVLLWGCDTPVEPQARELKTAPVQVRDIAVVVEAAGTIEPETTVEIKSKASGEILALDADTGSQLQLGALMVQIDKRIPRNTLAQSEAELRAATVRRDIARAQQQRAKTLYEAGTMNLTEYEQHLLEYANAEAGLVSSEVAVENARIALDDTEVRAPITGTVIEKMVEVGQVISSPTSDVGGGTLLLTMAELSSVQVRTRVDETDIGKIQPGQKVVVTVTAFPNQPFFGRVLKIEPSGKENSSVTMFTVIVNIANEARLLRPGMNAEVTVVIAQAEGVAAVPTMALRTLDDTEMAELYLGLDEHSLEQVLLDSQPADGEGAASEDYQYGSDYWVLVRDEGGNLAPRWVTTGVTDFDFSEVRSGLEVGETVVVMPSSGLIQSQERFQEFLNRLGGMPGMRDTSGESR